MNKRIAHYFISAIDVFSLVCLYWFFNYLSLLKERLPSADVLEYSNGAPFVLLILIIPFIHFLAILEAKIQLTSKTLSALNKLLIVIFFILIIFCFYINKAIVDDIKQYGFIFCQEQSRQINILTVKVFFKDDSKCTVL